MRFVIVTGMSGAGKSTALKMLEDAEYFCVDNLPIPLVEKFAQLTADGTSGEIQKVAVGIDIRSGQALPDLQNVLEWMSINGICYEILFLDASDDVLVKRYKDRLVYCAAISLVRSVEPVSTMMISSIMEATESRHLARTGSSFLTIIHKLIVIIITDGPSEVFLLYYTILQQFYIEIKKYTCIFFEPWL